MKEINLITLKCSNCSASLKFSDKIDRFICNYCGSEQLVMHNSDGFFFKKLEKKMADLERATERGNAELAIKRLKEDLDSAFFQLKGVQEKKSDLIFLLNNRRENSKMVLIGTAFLQMAILAFDFSFSIYIVFQVIIISTFFYQMRVLNIVQVEEEKVVKEFRPEIERISNEIEQVEIKIRKKVKFIDGK